MDIRDVLQAPIEHEPRRPNAASDFLRRVADEIEVLEHRTHAEQFVRVLYAGAFGIRGLWTFSQPRRTRFAS